MKNQMRKMQRLRLGRTVAGLFVLLFAAFIVPAHSADKAQRPPKDMAEAEKWFEKLEEAAGGRNFQFAIDQGTVSFQSRNGTTAMQLFAISSIGGVASEPIASSYAWYVHWKIEGDNTDWWIRTSSRSEIEMFREGLVYLARDAVRKQEAAEKAALERFKPKADAWRVLTDKPKMPENAYEHKVLAENAYKEKNLAKAMNEYELALGDFPTWPEGQFNEALIAAELGHYRIAAHRMTEYLLLVPNAPDAQAAKDNLIIWRDKITSP